MDLTKVAFSAGMMGNDLENMQAGTATATTISYQMAGASAQIQAMGANETTADAMALGAVFGGFDAHFAAINGSQMNNMTGNNETFTYSQAMSGQLADFTDMMVDVNSAMMVFYYLQDIVPHMLLLITQESWQMQPMDLPM
ncbi:MAG: hypothetical protein CXT70_04930 [Methanobacteriota archaeon]|nr:MAG: hypothetical protein CXT70_04930 [Euryarchaeota archaeon]